jgi:hypothetical protein
MLCRVLSSAAYTERLRIPFAFMTCLFVAIYFLSTDFSKDRGFHTVVLVE